MLCGTASYTYVCKTFIISVNFTILCNITGLFHHALQWLNHVQSRSNQFKPNNNTLISPCFAFCKFTQCINMRGKNFIMFCNIISGFFLFDPALICLRINFTMLCKFAQCINRGGKNFIMFCNIIIGFFLFDTALICFILNFTMLCKCAQCINRRCKNFINPISIAA